MTNQNNAAQPVLTDEEIQDIADGFDIYGAKPEFARAIESALLSKLRAPVADEQNRTAISQFLTDVMTAAGLVAHGKQCKALADRLGKTCMDLRLTATPASAPVADERISLRGAANLAFNALHECKPAKGAEKQYSDAIQALQSALHDIAYTVNRTATPQQFADHLQREARAALASAPVADEAQRPTLAVWYGSMPESNGKSNWTAILYRKDEGLGGGVNITLDRSEYPDRVRYEADRVRYLIGEIDKEPWILDYDADKCDAAPQASEALREAGIAASEDVVLPPLPEALALQAGQLGHTDQTLDYFARAAVLADRQQRAALSAQPGAQKKGGSYAE